MKFTIPLAASIVLSTIFVLTTQTGCGGGPDLREVYSTNIKKLHACYTMYMEDHNFTGPKDEAALKKYLKTDPTAIYLIKRIELTPEDIDGIFISDRDGEPFVVRYGLTGVANHAIVFEATGVEGRRLVALSDPTELEKAEYDGWLSGKTKPEQEAGSEGIDAVVE